MALRLVRDGHVVDTDRPGEETRPEIGAYLGGWTGKEAVFAGAPQALASKNIIRHDAISILVLRCAYPA